MRVKDARVVEENVHASEGGECFVNGTTAFPRLADIGADEDCLAALLQYPRGNCVPPTLVTAGDSNFGAFFREGEGRSFTDAGGSSGDECDFVGKAAWDSSCQLSAVSSQLSDFTSTPQAHRRPRRALSR